MLDISLLVHCGGGGADSGLVAYGSSVGGSIEGLVAKKSGTHGLVAHGVANVDEGALFLTPNLTVVEAHTGSSASLDCTVARGSDHGMVSYDNHQISIFFTQISWFLKCPPRYLSSSNIPPDILVPQISPQIS